ncbi:neugrin [Eublepharis macularius]|uniref:Neugrin n=1 Tax=Eublepharis macularius TaxID=481883 RepID=A0AA97LKN9_EUBMA|nr:neugrin [Eublepharis macularius]
MAARWGRLRAMGRRTLPAELETEEEAAARLELQRRAKAARLRRVQRLMEPSGPPERTLSHQAMEQIRHLRQDSPEEWPVARLARSFQVSPDVVGRVLRSRFSPSPERSLKQDGRLQGQRSGGGLLAREAAVQLVPACRTGGQAAAASGAAQRKRADPCATLAPAGGQPQRRSAEDPQPRLRVVQKGREFVDGDGNFLYRIPA